MPALISCRAYYGYFWFRDTVARRSLRLPDALWVNRLPCERSASPAASAPAYTLSWSRSLVTAAMKIFPLLIGSILLCTAAAASADPTALASARHALAVVSGKLHMPGLRQPVRVLRDRWGLAHIYAQNPHDLFFAQGFVAAQDRLFQMEVWKRAGQGRLSEILGPSAVARDLSARELAYRGDMQAEYRRYAPDTEQILQAFTQGINAYIQHVTASGGPGLPVEFTIAGFGPEAWHPRDCLNRMAAFSMTGNAASELQYARALTELGASK